MGTRRPTIEEAVRIQKTTLTDQQKRLNLVYWRERYGEAFVSQVVRSLKK